MNHVEFKITKKPRKFYFLHHKPQKNKWFTHNNTFSKNCVTMIPTRKYTLVIDPSQRGIIIKINKHTGCYSNVNNCVQFRQYIFAFDKQRRVIKI